MFKLTDILIRQTNLMKCTPYIVCPGVVKFITLLFFLILLQTHY